MKTEPMLQKEMIKILTEYATDYGWSQSMYNIVENDIKNNVFKTVDELIIYISQ